MRLRALVSVTVVIAVLASCSSWGEQEVTLEPTPSSSSTTGADVSGSPEPRPRTEDDARPVPEVDWSECGPGLECADLDVPLDHSDPDGDAIDIALVRRPARDPDQKIGSVVINPGGPGASGIEAVSYLLMPAAVTERFDVVGFDPRGVGQSSPLDCHSHLQAIYDADPTMEDTADVAHYWEVSEDFVDECEAEHADLLPHLGTENVARDLDLIRAAVGDDLLTYVGYSYGTSIGQQYARLFPERVRAMVLDGVVDTTMTGIEAATAQAEGFTRALDAYMEACDADSCFGEAAATLIDRVVAAAETSPIPAPGADRPATPGVVHLAMGQAMYSQLLWPQLTRALREAAGGDGTGLVELADSYLQREPDGSYGNGFEIYFAVSCIDSEWPDSFEDVLAAGKRAGEQYPRTGEALVNDYARCPLWPVEPDPLEPVPSDIEGLAPIVLISTTGDPATPYEAGVRVARSIPGARLITNVGEGHTIFANGKPCIDRTVADYIVDLTLPEDGLRCE